MSRTCSISSLSGIRAGVTQAVVHVFSAAAHVQLLQLTTDGRHVGLTQSAEDEQTNKNIRV